MKIINRQPQPIQPWLVRFEVIHPKSDHASGCHWAIRLIDFNHRLVGRFQTNCEDRS